MIALDRDVLVKLVTGDQAVIDHLKQYRGEEWTLPSLVAWESYKAQDTREEMLQTQRRLQADFDRILNFADDTALEAAYLQERFASQDVTLDAVDLLYLATAFSAGATFVTHNKNDFDRRPVHELTDVDIVRTD